MKTILIVEDDLLCTKLFNDLLQSHGFKTLHSIDGKDTIQLAA
jgi:two-component system, cell cycle response regulator DivK